MRYLLLSLLMAGPLYAVPPKPTNSVVSEAVSVLYNTNRVASLGPSNAVTLINAMITNKTTVISNQVTVLEGKTNNWNTAYSWGNHFGLYRLIDWVPSWNDVTNKPTTFTPAPHDYTSITNPPWLTGQTNPVYVAQSGTAQVARTAEHYSGSSIVITNMIDSGAGRYDVLSMTATTIEISNYDAGVVTEKSRSTKNLLKFQDAAGDGIEYGSYGLKFIDWDVGEITLGFPSESGTIETQERVASLLDGKVSTNDAAYLAAWQNPASSTNWAWSSDGTQITLTSYSGPADVVVPDTLDNLPVNILSYTVFQNDNTITSIDCGNITTVGEAAFQNCTSLTNVLFRKAVTFIGTGGATFDACRALLCVKFQSEVTLVRSMFFNCSALKEVMFGGGVAPEEKENFYYVEDDDIAPVTNYVTSSTATGWGATWCGRPVVRLPLYTDALTLGGTNLTTLLAGKLNTNGTAANSTLLAGYTIEDVMAVGATYYFTTNIVSYGVVSGRSASLTPPLVAQTLTYAGPVTNGQVFGQYLIPSNEVPAIIQRGVYTFNFFGGHSSKPAKNPTIRGKLSMINSGTGVTAYEYASVANVVIPYGEEPFHITVNVTNDVAKDSFAVLLTTYMLDDDGYDGDFISDFGPPTYAGFTFPKVNGLYVLKSEFDATSRGATNSTINGTAAIFNPATRTFSHTVTAADVGAVTNGQTNVVLGLASGTTVATATAGSEPATLDQVLSLLEPSSTLYLSPSNCTVCPQNTTTNRTLSATPSATAWTIVYSGAVTNGQYLFSFVAPSNEVATVLAGNQTASIYMTYAGGGGSTLSCKMEGYVYDPATSNSTEYAETATSFSVAKSGTLPTTPTTPIAVIPYSTNLTGNLRYQIRIKATTANNVTSVTMWGGGSSISHVAFPVSDSVTLGARGATGIKDSLGNAGTYDSTARTLTMPALTPAGIAAAGGVTNVIISTPISTLTTGEVVMVTPSQSKRVYQVKASVPITLTNDLSQLGANCTTNYEWETWINYTATNALSTVWDSRIAWQQQTPDLTVTGLYKFAFSTACGTIIQARQTYPTVYSWRGGMIGNDSGVKKPYIYGLVSTATPASTSTNYYAMETSPAVPEITRFSCYGGVATNNIVISSAIGFFYAVPTASSTVIRAPTTVVGAIGSPITLQIYHPASTGANNVDYIGVTMQSASTAAALNLYNLRRRPANELEINAYNAGWRP